MNIRIRAALLLTSDLDRAKTFYEQAFGLKKGRGGADMATHELEGASLAIMTRAAASKLTGLLVGEPPEIPAQFLALQASSRD